MNQNRPNKQSSRPPSYTTFRDTTGLQNARRPSRQNELEARFRWASSHSRRSERMQAILVDVFNEILQPARGVPAGCSEIRGRLSAAAPGLTMTEHGPFRLVRSAAPRVAVGGRRRCQG
jgi:hypothetical protein